jgi:hypothetical protein
MTTGCRPPPLPPPLPLHIVTAGKNQLNEEIGQITPLLPTGIGERCSQNHIKFGTCSALAPM